MRTHKLDPAIKVVGCWAHARQKFDEAVTVLPEEERAGAAAAEGLHYCNMLFAIEKSICDLPPEERQQKRLEQAKPVLETFLAWADTKNVAPKSKLGKALYYLHERWPYLMRYLEISNNRAERSIKPFVFGRKNSLFANTPGGAQGSATMYSIDEMARKTGWIPTGIWFRFLIPRRPYLRPTVTGPQG